MIPVKATVRGVARATGFSIATVSRVLNGNPRVSDSTRASILEAAKQLNYTPNAAARALATRRSRIIGVVIPTIESSIFATYVRSLEHTMVARGYTLVLATTYFQAEREMQRALQLLDMGAEALVVSGMEHESRLLESAERRGVPIVCTSVYDPGCPLPTIGYDNRALGAEATRYLLGLGHARIAVLHRAPRQAEIELRWLRGMEHESRLLESAERRGVPIVCTSVYDPGCPLPTIGYDNRALGAEATRYLLGLGHARIAVLHSSQGSNDRTRQRFAGARDVMPAGAQLTSVETEMNVAGGAEALKRVLALRDRPTALLCLSDVIAMGVLFEAERQQVKVPADLSVMGFDDLDWARNIEPRLSTVHLPVEEMGVAVAEALAARLDDKTELTHVNLPGNLVIRASTGPASA